MSNPFTDVHNAIWTMLEAHTGFTTYVTAGNRIKFTSAPYAIWESTIGEGDVPEVAVVMTGMKPLDRPASNANVLGITWEFWVTTMEQPTAEFYRVQWAIYRAMAHWETYLRDAVTWGGDSIVWDCNVLSVATPLATRLKAEQPRDTRLGWKAAWVYQTALCFSHSALLASTGT